MVKRAKKLKTDKEKLKAKLRTKAKLKASVNKQSHASKHTNKRSLLRNKHSYTSKHANKHTNKSTCKTTTKHSQKIKPKLHVKPKIHTKPKLHSANSARKVKTRNTKYAKRKSSNSVKNAVKLTKKDWQLLQEAVENEVYSYYGVNNTDELSWAEPLLENVVKKKLSANDIRSLIDILDRYRRLEGQAGNYAKALSYERLKNKLSKALVKLEKKEEKEKAATKTDDDYFDDYYNVGGW